MHGKGGRYPSPSSRLFTADSYSLHCPIFGDVPASDVAIVIPLSQQAGFIVSCVGSVRDVVLRLAGAERPSSACRPTATAHPGDPCADTKTPQGQGPQQREEEQQQQPMLSTGADARFEVLSLVGTLCLDGLHVHASLGDEEGAVCGGHLVRAIVHTTAELVIGEAPALVFGREMDPGTGFKELVVSDRSAGDREGCDGGADRR